MTQEVITRMAFGASPEEAWQGLVFYEQLGTRPPAHLRLLLPVPVGTEDQVSGVGDVARCVYESGHLVKQITRLERHDLYEFEVRRCRVSVENPRRGLFKSPGLNLPPRFRRNTVLLASSVAYSEPPAAQMSLD